MTTLRRRVRLWALAWLILQATSLSAFVPRDCCTAHRPVVATPTCHDAPQRAQCPMRRANGTPCPMHATTPNAGGTGASAASPSAHQGHDGHAVAETPADTQEPAADCVMRGTCRAPAVATVLAYPGLLPEPMPLQLDGGVRVLQTPLHEHPVARRLAPDPRPPRR